MNMKSSALGLIAAAALMSGTGSPEIEIKGSIPNKERLKNRILKAKQKRMRIQKESRKINR